MHFCYLNLPEFNEKMQDKSNQIVLEEMCAYCLRHMYIHEKLGNLLANEIMYFRQKYKRYLTLNGVMYFDRTKCNPLWAPLKNTMNIDKYDVKRH